VAAMTHRPTLEEYQTALETVFELHFKPIHMREDGEPAAGPDGERF
jgi:hypothetical protein